MAETRFCILTNHSQDQSLSFCPKFCTFESNTTSDWLNDFISINRKLCYSQKLLPKEKYLGNNTESVRKNGWYTDQGPEVINHS